MSHLPLLLSQSDHVPGPEGAGVDVWCSLAQGPGRFGWPRDSRMVVTGVVVGRARGGGSLAGSLSSWADLLRHTCS